jgi:hypothetical protein
MDLSGSWYQITLISGIEDSKERIRHGTCVIEADLDGITISAKNHLADKQSSFSSIWQSEIITMVGNKLVILWMSEGVRQVNAITRGTTVLHIDGKPPSKLFGSFTDASPAVNKGTITIYRNKDEYEKALDMLINNV